MSVTSVHVQCPTHGTTIYQLLCVHLLAGNKRACDWHKWPLPTQDIREVDSDWLCSGCHGYTRRRGAHDLMSRGKIGTICVCCVEILKMRAGFRWSPAGDEFGILVKP